MATRVLMAVLAIAMVTSSEVRADPPETSGEDEKAEAADKKAAKKAAKKAEPTKNADLRVKPETPSINLFPSQVFHKHSTKTEGPRRTTLGDDRDWKVQAAQVGAMVGIFGALVGACGAGKCMIPGSATDFLPDWMTADEPVYSNPRASQPVRSAR